MCSRFSQGPPSASPARSRGRHRSRSSLAGNFKQTTKYIEACPLTIAAVIVRQGRNVSRPIPMSLASRIWGDRRVSITQSAWCSPPQIPSQQPTTLAPRWAGLDRVPRIILTVFDIAELPRRGRAGRPEFGNAAPHLNTVSRAERAEPSSCFPIAFRPPRWDARTADANYKSRPRSS